MKHIGTIERPESTTRSYAFDYHVVRDQVELENIFAGYDGMVIVDGRGINPEDFQPYVLFRLDNGMKYHLDMRVAKGFELPFDVTRPVYLGADYFKGLE
jgi:hypothetical protein